MAGFNGVAWFEVGTDDPAGAAKFYGEVFGWTVGHDEGDGPGYQMFTAAGEGPGLRAGGLFGTGGAQPGYAVFAVLVQDVAEAVLRAEKAGGSVRQAPETTPGGITFAHLLDPAGNQFEVFSTPPGGE